jgi:hypothetical protein
MFPRKAFIMALVLAAATATASACVMPQTPSARPISPAMQAILLKANQQKAAPRPAGATQDAMPSIVGFWHSIFLLDPNGGYYTAGANVFDEGFEQWHSDGTEAYNDIAPPVTGNVCLGVWTQTGPLTYQLKHPTWFFDMASNTTLVGVGTFIEQVTLDPSGNSYTGTTTFDVLDLNGNSLFHLVTAIVAERIVADSQLFNATPGPAPGPMTTAVVAPQTLTTSQKSITLDGSGSTSAAGALTYFYSVLPGGKVPAILQSSNNPKATVEFVNGPGAYLLQLAVTDASGGTSISQPILLTYTGN